MCVLNRISVHMFMCVCFLCDLCITATSRHLIGRLLHTHTYTHTHTRRHTHTPSILRVHIQFYHSYVLILQEMCVCALGCVCVCVCVSGQCCEDNDECGKGTHLGCEFRHNMPADFPILPGMVQGVLIHTHTHTRSRRDTIVPTPAYVCVCVCVCDSAHTEGDSEREIETLWG